MKYNGYVDRVVDEEKIVILIDEKKYKKEFIIDKFYNGLNLEEGDWLIVNVFNDKLIDIKINNSLTKKREEAIKSKLNRLKKKKSSSLRKS